MLRKEGTKIGGCSTKLDPKTLIPETRIVYYRCITSILVLRRQMVSRMRIPSLLNGVCLQVLTTVSGEFMPAQRNTTGWIGTPHCSKK